MWAAMQQTPPVTATQVLQKVVDNAVKQWAERQGDMIGEDFRGKWDKLPAADRQKICAVVPMKECP